MLMLMDFDDEDYMKMKRAGVSNTGIQDLAGNTIVVSMLEEVFKSMFISSVIHKEENLCS